MHEGWWQQKGPEYSHRTLYKHRPTVGKASEAETGKWQARLTDPATLTSAPGQTAADTHTQTRAIDEAFSSPSIVQRVGSSSWRNVRDTARKMDYWKLIVLIISAIYVKGKQHKITLICSFTLHLWAGIVTTMFRDCYG